MTEPAAIQVVRRTTILAILVVRQKIHLSRANGQVEFRTLAIKLHVHLLVLDGIYMTICWTSDDCDGQVDLKLHLSVGQGILFPYFDHCYIETQS